MVVGVVVVRCCLYESSVACLRLVLLLFVRGCRRWSCGSVLVMSSRFLSRCGDVVACVGCAYGCLWLLMWLWLSDCCCWRGCCLRDGCVCASLFVVVACCSCSLRLMLFALERRVVVIVGLCVFVVVVVVCICCC